MSLIGRCDECHEVILKRALQYKCGKCGAFFCSIDCQEKHHCIGLPPLRIPWEEDIEFEPDKLDIIGILKNLLKHEQSIGKKKKQTKMGKKSRCLYCNEKKRIIWNDIDLGPLCADCYDEMRIKTVKEICSETDDCGTKINQYKIVRIQDDPNTGSTHLLALCLAKMELEKREYIDISVETAGRIKSEKFELYDFRVWVNDTIMIMHLDNRILEFTPGTYLILGDK